MSVKISPPNDALKRKLGAPVRALAGPREVAAMQAAMAAAAEAARPAVLEQLRALEALSRTRPLNAPTQLFAKAHMIRGLAGSCGLVDVGRAAHVMCILLDGVEDEAQIDANLVTSIAVTMLHAAKATGDGDRAMLEELIAACTEAVSHARSKGTVEGRAVTKAQGPSFAVEPKCERAGLAASPVETAAHAATRASR